MIDSWLLNSTNGLTNSNFVPICLKVAGEFFVRKNPWSEVSIGDTIDQEIPSCTHFGCITFDKMVESVQITAEDKDLITILF